MGKDRKMMMMMMMMMMLIMKMLMMAHPWLETSSRGWRPPHVGGWVQRDTALKLIASHFAKIQNWGSC